jgi:hypothetical protein
LIRIKIPGDYRDDRHGAVLPAGGTALRLPSNPGSVSSRPGLRFAPQVDQGDA